jgi:hypothetical protein
LLAVAAFRGEVVLLASFAAMEIIAVGGIVSKAKGWPRSSHLGDIIVAASYKRKLHQLFLVAYHLHLFFKKSWYDLASTLFEIVF